MATTDHLTDTMRTISRTRSKLREVYMSSLEHFHVMQKLIRDDTGKRENTFITEDGERLIENALSSDPVIVVCGQINSGKTSLINELLGGSYLPTLEIPCTARIVRVKHAAAENYLQVCDEHGAPISERITFIKKVPSEEIALIAESRDDETEVKRIVEVGLNHPMLAHGLQIVDLPGLSESETLNNVVKKVLDGRMQLLIYVINGKNSLRTQDVTFISYLKNIAPNMDITFVCNKVEVDLKATEADGWDDGTVEEMVDKADLAYSKLKTSRLIPPTQQYGPSLENYHGISCRRVREARIKNRDDEFMQNFNRFKAAMMSKFTICVQSQLSEAITHLSRTQKRFYDFFVVGNEFELDSRDYVSLYKRDLEQKQDRFFRAMKENITQKLAPLIRKMLLEILKLEIAKIRESVDSLQFPCLVINDGLGETRLKNYRQQVREYILMLFNTGFENVVSTIETWFTEEMKVSAPKFAVATNDYESRILKMLLPTMPMHDMNVNMDDLKTKWLAGLGERVNTKLTKYYEDMTFCMKNTLSLDTKWKVETGLAVLESIDTEAVTAHIVSALNDKMTDTLQSYHSTFCLLLHFRLADLKNKLACHPRDILTKIFPDYCRNLVVADALITTVTYGAVTLGERIGKESRMEVFECNEWNQKYNSRCGQSLHLVAKKEIVRSIPLSDALCTHYCRSRVMPDSQNLQMITAVVFDKDWDLCIILPHYDLA